MKSLPGILTSRYAGWVAVLLAGLAACQGVELGVGVKPAVPPPDPAVVQQIEGAKAEVAAAEQKTQEAARLAGEAEAARAAAVAAAADLERKVAAGEATEDELERARLRATEAATEATQAKERADRARAWTDDFSTRVTAANDRLAKAEEAWRDAEGQGLDIEGPKDTTPWGLLSWAICVGPSAFSRSQSWIAIPLEPRSRHRRRISSPERLHGRYVLGRSARRMPRLDLPSQIRRLRQLPSLPLEQPATASSDRWIGRPTQLQFAGDPPALEPQPVEPHDLLQSIHARPPRRHGSVLGLETQERGPE